MEAILTAGGTPQPDEPLYTYSQGKPKALLEIAGKSLIQWILDAFSQAESIDRIFLVGLPPSTPLHCTKPVTMIEDQGEMLPNILKGIAEVKKANPKANYIVVCSSDIPALRPEMIDWLAKTIQETQDDLYYLVVERQIMEKRYPNSRRTYTHLKGIEVCGGDINAVRLETLNLDNPFWGKLIAARKQPLKQAALLGFDNLLRVLFRTSDLDSTVRHVCQRVGVKGRAIRTPYAEMGMDIDKPNQYELVSADLMQRVAA